jgi:TrmH family RNA methyltransferase
LIEDALDHGAAPPTVVVAPELLETTARGRALLQRLRHHPGLPSPLEVTPSVLRHLAATETPSGAVAALPLPPTTTPLPRQADLAVVLDGVQDPGNAGTILRTASAVGVGVVIALAESVDLFAPKVVRAAMGAHQRLAIYQDVTPADLAPWLAGQGQALVADAHARDSIYEFDLRRPTTLVVGSEAHGPARAAAFGSLRPVAIPMPGGAESLNVAVATAIILFEAVRQRSTADSSTS